MLAWIYLSALLLSGRVWIVDPSTDGSLADIQSTIDAASDGDVVLVRTGAYLPFTLDGRSLRVLADVGGAVEIQGTITVRNLPPDGVVVLGGLGATGTPRQPTSDPGLSLVGDAGFVRVERCTFRGGVGYTGAFCTDLGDGGSGAAIVSSARVVLAACTLEGGVGGYDQTGSCQGRPGGDGLLATGSTIALYDASVRGGDGGSVVQSGFPQTGGRGGQGLVQDGGRLFASATLFWGGNGGTNWFGGDGGDASELDDATADLRACVFRPGRGSLGLIGEAGQNGQQRVGNGTFDFLAGTARVVSGPLLVPDFGPLRITVTGMPGDRVWIVGSKAPAQRFVESLGGERLVRSPSWLSLDPQGIVPASGSLVLDIPRSPLAPPAQFDGTFYQAVVSDRSGALVLCGPLHPTVLACGAIAPDCNGNGLFDGCDILGGTSQDCQPNGIPDECETDCNGNGFADSCDIASGRSADRNRDGIPDECETNRAWYVDAAAASGGDGSSARPFRAIAEGVAAALSGDTILVRDGVYSGPSNRGLRFAGLDLVVRSVNGAEHCAIDCELADRAFLIDAGEGPAARIEGFTIRNGSAPAGGAIRVAAAHATIADCVFVNDHADSGTGGAVVLEGSSSTVTGCVFLANQANEGGALAASFGHPRIEACVFQGNFAALRGGAVSAGSDHGGPLIADSRFFGNLAADRGGALDLWGPSAQYVATRLVQCLLVGNEAPRGSAVQCRLGRVDMLDLTMTGGQASESSTIWIQDAAIVQLRNSIVWGNASGDGRQTTLSGAGASAMIGWCDVEGGVALVAVGPGSTVSWDAGNVAVDPRFVDPDGPDGDPSTFEDDDFRLAATSPCIDAGDDLSVPADALDLDGDGNTTEPWPFDLDGLARFVDQAGVPDTGNGGPPVVDIGCYERP